MCKCTSPYVQILSSGAENIIQTNKSQNSPKFSNVDDIFPLPHSNSSYNWYNVALQNQILS